MGILDKVMFWKKKDEFADIGLGDKENLAFGDQFGAGGQPGVPGGTPPGLGPATGLGPEPMGQGLGQQPAPAMPPPAPSMPSFSPPPPPPPPAAQPSYANPQQDLESKNLEVISSKLDAIRASLESLNQRLANLEAIARGDEENSRRRKYY